MKAVVPFFALAAAALIAAGCSSGTNNALFPSGSGSASHAEQAGANAAVADALKSAWQNGCGEWDGSRWHGSWHGGCHSGLVATLAYDGTNGTFSVAGCNGDDATPYTAPTSGPLAVATPAVVVAPTCAATYGSPPPTASPAPTTTPTSSSSWRGGGGGGNSGATNLYVVLFKVKDHGHEGNGHSGHMAADWFNTYRFVALAGPAPLDTNPWTFPTLPAVQLTGGDQYLFLIIAARRPLATPSPEPTATPTPCAAKSGCPTPTPTPAATATPTPPAPTGFFHPIVPLTFDGTSFTVSSTFTSCSQWWDETPYVASTSGPLTLTSSPTVTPTCVPAMTAPSPAPSADAKHASWGGAGGGTPPGLYVIGVQIPNASPSAIRSRNPHDWGLPFPAFPATAIAGPVSPAGTSWIFPPITPGLYLTAGNGYVFFVAVPVGGGCSSGGSNWCGGGGN